MATVLVVDDHAVNREFLTMLIDYAGHSAVEAANGNEALARVRTAAPDLIITDLMMPVMDGYELTRRLREDPATAAIPVIFYTATFRVHEAYAMARACGVEVVLPKPSEPQAILAAIAKLLGAPVGVRSQGEVPAQPAPLRGLTELQQRLHVALDPGAPPAAAGGETRMGVHALSLRLAALLEIGLTVVAERDPQRLLDLFCRAAQDLFGTRHAGVVIGEVGRAPELWAASGLDQAALEALGHVDLDRGPLGTALRTEAPVNLSTLAGDATRGGLPTAHPAIDTLLVAPIVTPSGLRGVLYVADKVNREAFNDEDEQFAAMLSAQLALAYGGLRLYADAKRHAAALEAEVVERRRVADALRGSEARFRQIAENIREVFFLVDVASTQILYVSPAYEEVWGRSCASLHAEPRSWMDGIHPEDLPRVQAEVALHASGAPFANRYRLLRPDGTLRWIRTRGFPISEPNGVPYRLAGIAEDITDQERALQRLRVSERRFDDMLSNVRMISVMLDADARVTYCNDYLIELTGWRRDEVLGNSWFDQFLPSETVDELLGAFRNRMTEVPNAWHHENEILTRNGARRLIRWHNTALRDESGSAVGTASLGEDITERVEQERKIARLSRLRAVTGGISSAMLRLTDRDALLDEACQVAVTEGIFPMACVGVLDAITQTFEIGAFRGGSPEAAQYLTAGARAALLRETLPAYRVLRTCRPVVVNDFAIEPGIAPMCEAVAKLGFRSSATLPLFVGGRVVAVLVLLAAEKDFFDAEELDLLEWLAADLSFALEHIEKSARLDYLAYYDTLTGLPNARLFRDRLDQLVHAAREESRAVDVLALDLERFTQINEAYGRASGDALLRAVGERLKLALVEPYTLAHIAADMYAVASTRAPGTSITKLYDTVRTALQQAFAIDGRDVWIGLQAGVAQFPDDGPDAEALMHNAEAALKLAKSGAARCVYHSSETNERLMRRIALEEELHRAVAGREFVIHYQPRIDMLSGELVGAEGLIRWQHPERGLVPPTEFIGIAEETGLIEPIGAWVIDTVCAQQSAWLRASLGAVPVAVNLSAVQLRAGGLLESVRATLEKVDLEPRFLELELTESAVMEDPIAAATVLGAMRKYGVRLALDDFGTGYSSLAQLKRFPFNSVKIDRSFITDITRNAEDAAIATAIIAMAHRLGLKVCAEGVETIAQFTYLRAQDCDEMQGNFFSAPLPADGFEALLREGRSLVLPVTPGAEQPTLLLVDDEQGIRSALMRVLRRDGYRILTANGGDEALELLAVNPVQVIVSDQRMPGMSGTEFLATVKQLYPDTVRIVLSGYTDLETVTDAVNRGSVFKFLTKPWDDDLLREQVRDAFRRHRPSLIT